MGRKKWFLILHLLIFSFSFSENLDTLLSKYEKETQLYKKTRQESEGHIILITREDIERVQAHKLSDILRSIRYFFLQRNHYGEEILSYATIYPLENSTVRLFINDHEISAIFRKTALPLWADLPLDFVEHIEIYQGESAVKFNNEAAGTIIKIYTKKPERENSGLLRGSIDSRGGFSMNTFFGTEISENSSFLFFINRSDYKTKKYSNNTKLNTKNYYAYFQINIKGWNFESGLVKKNSNLFRGDTLFKEPDYSDLYSSHGYVSLKNILSQELNLQLRIYGDKISHNTYQKGNSLNPVIASVPVQPVLLWEKNVNSFKIGTDFKGEKKYKKYLISFGGKLQKTGYKLYDTRNTGKIYDENSETYTAFFLENTYNITPHIGVIGGIKYEKINRDYGSDINSLLWRVGSVVLFSEKRYGKVFVSKYYTPPCFVEIYTNKDLKKQKNRIISLELSEENSIGHFRLTGGYIKVTNTIMIDPATFRYYNSKDTLKYTFFSIDYKKTIKNITIESGFFNVNVNNKKYKTAPSMGGKMVAAYKNSRFSTFFELLYRDSFKLLGKKIKKGFELNAGIKINTTKDSYLELKGYNLLNEAQKIPALNDPNFKYFLDDRRVVFTFVKEF